MKTFAEQYPLPSDPRPEVPEEPPEGDDADARAEWIKAKAKELLWARKQRQALVAKACDAILSSEEKLSPTLVAIAQMVYALGVEYLEGSIAKSEAEIEEIAEGPTTFRQLIRSRASRV